MVVRVSQVKSWLFPPSGADEGFYQESLSLSGRGARVGGFLEIGVGLASFVGGLPWPTALGVLVLGVLTWLATRIDALFEHSRAVVAIGLGLGALGATLSLPHGLALVSVAILLLAAPTVVPEELTSWIKISMPAWEREGETSSAAAASRPAVSQRVFRNIITGRS